MRVPSLDENVVNVVHTGKDDPTLGLINILSYDLLPKHLETLKRKHFKVIIAVCIKSESFPLFGFIINLQQSPAFYPVRREAKVGVRGHSPSSYRVLLPFALPAIL